MCCSNKTAWDAAHLASITDNVSKISATNIVISATTESVSQDLLTSVSYLLVRQIVYRPQSATLLSNSSANDSKSATQTVLLLTPAGYSPFRQFGSDPSKLLSYQTV